MTTHSTYISTATTVVLGDEGKDERRKDEGERAGAQTAAGEGMDALAIAVSLATRSPLPCEPESMHLGTEGAADAVLQNVMATVSENDASAVSVVFSLPTDEYSLGSRHYSLTEAVGILIFSIS